MVYLEQVEQFQAINKFVKNLLTQNTEYVIIHISQKEEENEICFRK